MTAGYTNCCLCAPKIISKLSRSTRVGASFRYQIAVALPASSYQASGLPPGLTIDPDTGIISGTPTKVGRFNVFLTAYSEGCSATAVLTIAVDRAIEDCPAVPLPCCEVSTKNESGPDVPGIQCWAPIDCCLPSPCSISEWDFLCATRALLPEGDIYNNTRAWAKEPARNVGVITVGCARVGCEQLILGSCCDDTMFCDDDPVAPQLAVVDAYAAVVYGVLRALCAMMKELDPCTADITLQRWGERFGIVTADLCEQKWSDHVLALLICTMLWLRQRLINMELLEMLAARFGADLKVRDAGDFSECHPPGWWTMARDRAPCPPPELCPPDKFPLPDLLIRMKPECQGKPDSINIVLCPSEIRIPENCNVPTRAETHPHDPELYQAFQWLLPKILPQPVFWCIYLCDPPNCIV